MHEIFWDISYRLDVALCCVFFYFYMREFFRDYTPFVFLMIAVLTLLVPSVGNYALIFLTAAYSLSLIIMMIDPHRLKSLTHLHFLIMFVFLVFDWHLLSDEWLRADDDNRYIWSVTIGSYFLLCFCFIHVYAKTNIVYRICSYLLIALFACAPIFYILEFNVGMRAYERYFYYIYYTIIAVQVLSIANILQENKTKDCIQNVN